MKYALSNIYTLLRIYKKIKSPRIKILGLYLVSKLGIRHLSIRIDPALSCNLFCLMCYFSQSDVRKQKKGQLSEEDMTQIARIFFPKAFQLVIGCGAEPTINRDFMKIFQLGRQYNVPNLSIVTNGLLLRDSQIEEMIELGVNEIILSTHGLTKANYEKFMVNGKHEQFIYLLNTINRLKEQYQSDRPAIRINYTVNEENLKDLDLFGDFVNSHKIQTLQVRPIMDIGGKYTKLLDDSVKEQYNATLKQLKTICDTNQITLLGNTTDINYSKINGDSLVLENVYTYISSDTVKKYNLNSTKTKLSTYKKQIGWTKNLFSGLSNKTSKKSHINNSLKYDIL